MTNGVDRLALAIHDAPLTPAGRRLAAEIRAGDAPSRRVRNASSVTVVLVSWLMKRTMRLESRTLEAARASALDASPATKEFYEQPVGLSIPFRAPDALRATTRTYHPDFFVIENTGAGLWIGFEEVKPERALVALAEAEPERYVRSEDGRWHDLLVEDFVRPTYGLEHRIITDRDLPATITRNATFLEEYRVDPIELDPVIRAKAVRFVKRYPGDTATALMTRVPELSVDALHQMIANGAIWFAADRDLLKDHDRVRLFTDPVIGMAVLSQPSAKPVDRGELILAVGERFHWGEREYEIANLGEGSVDTLAEGVVTTFKRAELERLFLEGRITGTPRAVSVANVLVNRSDKAYARFIERQRRIEAARPGDRAAARWRRDKARQAQVDGHGVGALVPNFANCGRRGRRRSDDDRALALKVLEEQYLSPEQRSLRIVHGMYEKRFRAELTGSDRNQRPMSRPHFKQLLYERWSAEDIARARKGHRAANAAALRGPLGGGAGCVYQGLPINGDRAWERVHIDHTELDIWVVDSKTREPIARPWCTIARDAFSGKTLAFDVSFDAPSRKALLSLVRRMVRLHHRLPQIVVTDNGKEFRSIYFQKLCAAYEVRQEYRPAGDPRYGSPVEAQFHRLNKVVHAARGNTRPAQDARSLDRDLAPEKRAVWTLMTLIEELIGPALDLLDREIDPVSGKSANDRYAESMAAAGTRRQRLIAYDSAFMYLSAIPREDPVQVGPQGIVIDRISYWTEAFRDNTVQGTTVDVREDPYDISTKYACVKGIWQTCRSERFRDLEGRTADEIEAASKELSVRLKREPSLTELVDFIVEFQSRERELADEKRAAHRRERLHLVSPEDEVEVLGEDPTDAAVAAEMAGDATTSIDAVLAEDFETEVEPGS